MGESFNRAFHAPPPSVCDGRRVSYARRKATECACFYEKSVAMVHLFTNFIRNDNSMLVYIR